MAGHRAPWRLALVFASVIASASTDALAATSMQYAAHVENSGWQAEVKDGRVAGTTGQGLRLEALRINLTEVPSEMVVCYEAHVENIGWQSEVCGSLDQKLSFAESGRRDAAYESLDLQALRVTTEFRDARAVSERLPSGALATRLLSPDGRPLVRIHAGPERRGRVQLPGEAMSPGRGKEALDAYRTADDSNLAAYAVWKNRGVADFSSGEMEREIISVRSEFRDFDAVSRVHPEADADPTLPSFTTALFDLRTGELVGRLAWYAEPGLLAWGFRDGSGGSVSPDTLGKAWHFRPGPSWANLQIFGLFSTRSPGESVGKGEANETARAADERGCDQLHWLDNTILRPCCDRHDLCYRAVQPACTARSWYYWHDNWSCVKCNAEVVFCFAAGTAKAWWDRAFYWGVVDWGSDGYVDCGISIPGVCPAWCRSCLGR